jgi:diguanylate cyclase (GGDEF)-like protein
MQARNRVSPETVGKQREPVAGEAASRATRGWLCPTELDRQRAVDTSPRVRRARLTAWAFIGAGALVVAPILNWWLLALCVVSIVNLVTLDWVMSRSRRPERPAAGSMAFTGLILAVAAAITGGPDSPVLPLLVLPVAIMPARFRGRVVLVGAAIGTLTIIGTGLIVDAQGLIDDPALTIVTLALLGSVVAIASAIQGAEIQHRSESVIDPLTGLLNRKALLPRWAELEHQAHLSGAPLCIIEADLDHFKAVNDTHGHERGDAVLRDAAYEMRKSLRSFELIYRLGGEEFLIVLPRASLAEGVRIAERVRETVERTRPGGIDITVSLGVTAARGDGVDYEAMFGAADDALYAAKNAGRNRVSSRSAANQASEPKLGVPATEPVPA